VFGANNCCFFLKKSIIIKCMTVRDSALVSVALSYTFGHPGNLGPLNFLSYFFLIPVMDGSWRCTHSSIISHSAL